MKSRILSGRSKNFTRCLLVLNYVFKYRAFADHHRRHRSDYIGENCEIPASFLRSLLSYVVSRLFMKQFLLVVAAGLTLASCEKSMQTNSLAGNWRMISVKDRSTNAVLTKPPGISGEVDIAFIFSAPSTGVLSGTTPTNSLEGEFTIGSSAIFIPSVSQTKVMETSWGSLFLDNIRNSENYFFDNGGRLNISANTQETLTFVRR